MAPPFHLTRRRAALAAAILLAAVAAWHLGSGFYVYGKAMLAQHLLRDAWSRTVAGELRVRPWPWADTWPVARLSMPGHGVDLIVLAGASGRTMAFGPGHLDGTPAPGTAGNSIIGGHRDTSLRFLARVRPGQRLVVETPAGGRIAYRVTGSRIVDARRPWLSPDVPGRMLTLVTCYPFDAVAPGGPLRYLVFAEEDRKAAGIP